MIPLETGNQASLASGPAPNPQTALRSPPKLIGIDPGVAGALADTAAARLCLKRDDDAGARYHLKRVVECVKAATPTFRELERLNGRGG